MLVKLLMAIDFLLFRDFPETYLGSGQNPAPLAI